MFRLVDCYNGNVTLIETSTKSTVVLKKINVISTLKCGVSNIDNIKLSNDGKDIVCSSGSISRLEKYNLDYDRATILEVREHKDKKDNEYIIITFKNHGVSCKGRYGRDFIEKLVSRGCIFNAFIRNGNIVINGPVFRVDLTKDTIVPKATFYNMIADRNEIRPLCCKVKCNSKEEIGMFLGMFNKMFSNNTKIDTEDNCVTVNLNYALECYITFFKEIGLDVLYKFTNINNPNSLNKSAIIELVNNFHAKYNLTINDADWD